MSSDAIGDEQFIEQNKKMDAILKKRDDKMIVQYGEEGWEKKKEEDLKRVHEKLKAISKPKIVPKTENNIYDEIKKAEKTQMPASESEKKQDVGIKEDSNKLDVADDVLIVSDPESEKRELKPVEYKGNYLGGQKAIKDKIFNKTRTAKSLKNATTLLIYLIQHSAWKDKNDKHRTYKNWYAKKQLIVASRSQGQMALDLGVSVRTIQRWLDELERDKLIKREIESRENVYILGRVRGDKEFFFYERK